MSSNPLSASRSLAPPPASGASHLVRTVSSTHYVRVGAHTYGLALELRPPEPSSYGTPSSRIAPRRAAECPATVRKGTYSGRRLCSLLFPPPFRRGIICVSGFHSVVPGSVVWLFARCSDPVPSLAPCRICRSRSPCGVPALGLTVVWRAAISGWCHASLTVHPRTPSSGYRRYQIPASAALDLKTLPQTRTAIPEHVHVSATAFRFNHRRAARRSGYYGSHASASVLGPGL